MLQQGPRVVIARRPYVVVRHGRDRHERAATGTAVRAGHDVPTRTIPVLYQRTLRPRNGDCSAHGPNIISRDSRYTAEIACNVIAEVRTANDTPGQWTTSRCG